MSSKKAKSASSNFRKKKKDSKQDKRIKKLENIIYPSLDWKTKDTRAADAAISTTPYTNYPMFALTKGTNDNERAGDKVSLRHATMHLTLTRGDSSNMVRVLVVKTPSSSHLTISDVLEYPDVATYGDTVFCSPLQVKAENSEKTYKVLYDKVYQIRNDQASIVDKIKFKIPKKGIECNFVGDSSVQPNNYTISLLMISDSTATPHPMASYVMRWKYIDL